MTRHLPFLSAIFVVACLGFSRPALAAPETVLLWPQGAPGAKGDGPSDKPTLNVYRPTGDQLAGAAVVVCPGGGYGGLAKGHEGVEIAKWFNSFGVTALVLHYRVSPYRHPIPLGDVRRALRYTRAHSKDLGIDPNRIGVMGFSAGGHLAASAGTLFAGGNKFAEDPLERLSSRPDFLILGYPVITLTKPFAHLGSRRNLLGVKYDSPLAEELSLENRVTARTPPTFLFHTTADRAVPPENSVAFYSALRKAGVPAEMHIYRDGPHGVGLNRHPSITSWPGQLRLWMQHMGLLLPPEHLIPKWVWLGSDFPEGQTVYFRKLVEIDADISEALLAGVCDNQMTVFVNGKRVLTSSNWETPVRANLRRTLRRGLNVIAVRGHNQSGPAGLLLRMVVRTPEGVLTTPTDKTWWVSAEKHDGWKDLDFEPEAWHAATEIARLGEGTWSQVTESTLSAAESMKEPTATPVEAISLASGFRAELIYTVPSSERGSWVSLAVDGRGRIIACDQYGALYRFSPPRIGRKLAHDDVERLQANIGGAHGLLYAFDSLYVVRGEGGAHGLYRLRDTTGDDQFDEVKLLRKLKGGGEHGPHSVILSPDGKSLYVCAGNHTDLPDPEKSLVPPVWKEDLLLPRMWDASGHARGKLAPGGWIARTDPEGKTWEIVSIGYRNEFDIAFSPEGELFTYDADMEWDIGAPWYRPTRVNHVISGSEFGWRSGTGKWPEYYPDSVGSVVDIGPGSPTGIVFGTGTNFPEKYQRALFIADWSYGKLYAVHLEPDGASWKGTAEQFMAASPLPLTDPVVNPVDGALYVAIGGRRTQSGVYRITHPGGHRAKKLKSRANKLVKLRNRLEAFHGEPDPRAVEFAWPFLSHEDRYIRYAARIAVETQPVASWQEKALAETNPVASIHALIALARHGDKALQPKILAALGRVSWKSSSDDMRLWLLRAYSLAFSRMGASSAESAAEVASRLSPHYPADSYNVNRELSRLMVYLETPDAAAKTMALLANAPTQEEQIHYALVLRVLKTGWSVDQRRRYFQWFHNAGAYRGGHSFAGFLRNIKNEAASRLSGEERKSLAAVLAAPKKDPITDLPKPRGPGRDWTVGDLLPAVEKGLKNRDFENGKNMFAAAYCFSCHRFAGRGAAAAPDLTGLGGRFNPQNLLEAIIEPSKVVSDQYQATIFELKDGPPVVGRIVNLGGDSLMINTNMRDPNGISRISSKRILRTRPSPLSMMPEGLLQPLSEDEVLDLLAYLLSRGDPGHPAFRRE